MPVSRNYSSTAGRMSLIGAIGAANVSIVVDTTVGLPAAPFTLMLDPGVAAEEIVEVTAIGGTTLTVSRGIDGTTGQAHLNGAEVRHAYSARDFRESRVHEAAVGAVHGVAGALVGTTDVQVLTGKVIDFTLNTITNLPIPAVPPAYVPTGVYATVTSNVACGATLDLIATAPPITGNGSKVFKITASWPDAVDGAAETAYLAMSIRESDGTTVLGRVLKYFTATAIGGGVIQVVTVPSVGTHTYKLYANGFGASGTIIATATTPIVIVVEQIA